MKKSMRLMLTSAILMFNISIVHANSAPACPSLANAQISGTESGAVSFVALPPPFDNGILQTNTTNAKKARSIAQKTFAQAKPQGIASKIHDESNNYYWACANLVTDDYPNLPQGAKYLFVFSKDFNADGSISSYQASATGKLQRLQAMMR